MKSNIPPCKDCDQRQAGCHARCPAYISWRKQMNETRKELNRMASEEVYFQDRSHWFDHL